MGQALQSAVTITEVLRKIQIIKVWTYTAFSVTHTHTHAHMGSAGGYIFFHSMALKTE